MSRKYKEVEIPARTEKKRIAFICDFCGRETKQKHGGDANWTDGAFEINVVTVSRESGTCYPEGPDVKLEIWDICAECFDEQLRPILPSSLNYAEI